MTNQKMPNYKLLQIPSHCHPQYLPHPLQLRNFCGTPRRLGSAALLRSIAKRSDLEAPDWLAQEWHKGTAQREQMAATLQEVNWDKVGSIFNPMFPIPTIYDVTHACFFSSRICQHKTCSYQSFYSGMSTTDL